MIPRAQLTRRRLFHQIPSSGGHIDEAEWLDSLGGNTISGEPLTIDSFRRHFAHPGIQVDTILAGPSTIDSLSKLYRVLFEAYDRLDGRCQDAGKAGFLFSPIDGMWANAEEAAKADGKHVQEAPVHAARLTVEGIQKVTHEASRAAREARAALCEEASCVPEENTRVDAAVTPALFSPARVVRITVDTAQRVLRAVSRISEGHVRAARVRSAGEDVKERVNRVEERVSQILSMITEVRKYSKSRENMSEVIPRQI